MLSKISEFSTIPYTIRLYDEFQKDSVVRKVLLNVLKKKDVFEKTLSPSEKRLRLRFSCPKCKYTEKSAENLQLEILGEHEVQLRNHCFEHGSISVIISENKEGYFDMNVPL